ncbi:hypothetical protein [Metallibacterium scheffleri]|uniref:Uncharacterized protein n=1 Tax=Metallibacterium scheffleri TaxID=993689 RepID=A0A4S3KT33_9GAMM|nr:hypothetical protein [Metallibacterium scheffleri]THD11384.1 hypothetical protein B1806_04515 [Metallibacterium scheffleri]
MSKFVVSYELPYVHHVRVGIEAEDAERARAAAEDLFNSADLWNDTPDMPLLMDEYEEDGDAGTVLEFEAVHVEEWPDIDGSVKEIHRHGSADAFVAAFLEWEHNGAPVDELDSLVALAKLAKR